MLLCKILISPVKNYKMAAVSGLAFINCEDKSQPFTLFLNWIDAAKRGMNKNFLLMNLATTSKNLHVSNRYVVLRGIKNNKLIFTSNENSKKISQISENPNVAASFLFSYLEGDKNINRQIRIEGRVEKLSKEESQIYYEQEPLYCKIRSHICKQGEIVDWDSLKSKHDQLLEEVITKKTALNMPSYFNAYEIDAHYVEFYYGFNNFIADRVAFQKIDEYNWEFNRIAA